MPILRHPTPPTEVGGVLPAEGNAMPADVVLDKTFSNQYDNTLVGTLVVPDASTGNAVAGDVALNKTFSNAAGVGHTGTSTKNATISGSCAYQPASCAEAVIYALANFSSGTIDFSSVVGLTTAVLPAAFYPQYQWSINFSGCSLLAASVDGILATASGFGGQASSSINLGGANAAPTPQAPYIPGYIDVDFCDETGYIAAIDATAAVTHIDITDLSLESWNAFTGTWSLADGYFTDISVIKAYIELQIGGTFEWIGNSANVTSSSTGLNVDYAPTISGAPMASTHLTDGSDYVNEDWSSSNYWNQGAQTLGIIEYSDQFGVTTSFSLNGITPGATAAQVAYANGAIGGATTFRFNLDNNGFYSDKPTGVGTTMTATGMFVANAAIQSLYYNSVGLIYNGTQYSGVF